MGSLLVEQLNRRPLLPAFHSQLAGLWSKRSVVAQTSERKSEEGEEGARLIASLSQSPFAFSLSLSARRCFKANGLPQLAIV